MKRLINFLLIIILISFFNSCTEEEEIYSTIDDGIYEGTFIIVESDGKMYSGKVTFTFNKSTYTCVPEIRYLPPSGGGSFQTNKNKIMLEDKVIHTAEFDWTLILNGEFYFIYDGNKLILKQNDMNHNRYRDIELLKKEK